MNLLCFLQKIKSSLVFQAILLFTFLDFKRSSYGDYKYPLYADVIGWIIALAEIGCIPAVALYKIFKADSNLSIIQVRFFVGGILDLFIVNGRHF